MANVFFNPRFVKSVWLAADIPAPPLPIVAFAGRSNAGKSSLINALCNAKTAKVSRTPGKTRMINIFQIQSRLLADMPGYGYAKVPMEEKRGWQEKINGFLPNVRALVLVVDCRRGIGVLDAGMLALCARATGEGGGGLSAVVIALTKADKLPRGKLVAAESRARAFVGNVGNAGNGENNKDNNGKVILPNVQVLPVSSNTGANVATLRAMLTKETA